MVKMDNEFGEKSISALRIFGALSLGAGAAGLALALPTQSDGVVEALDQYDGYSFASAGLMMIIGGATGAVAGVTGIMAGQLNKDSLGFFYMLLLIASAGLSAFGAISLSGGISKADEIIIPTQEAIGAEYPASTPEQQDRTDFTSSIYQACCTDKGLEKFQGITIDAEKKTEGPLKDCTGDNSVDENFRTIGDIAGLPADLTLDFLTVCNHNPAKKLEYKALWDDNTCKAFQAAKVDAREVQIPTTTLDLPQLFKFIPDLNDVNVEVEAESVPIIGWPLSGDPSKNAQIPPNVGAGLDPLEVFGCGLGFTKAFFLTTHLYLEQTFGTSIIISYAVAGLNVVSALISFVIIKCMNGPSENEWQMQSDFA